MRVVFMGTPAFAVPSLVALAREHEVALVVTRPDAVRSRGKRLEPSPVKEAALELGTAGAGPHGGLGHPQQRARLPDGREGGHEDGAQHVGEAGATVPVERGAQVRHDPPLPRAPFEQLLHEAPQPVGGRGPCLGGRGDQLLRGVAEALDGKTEESGQEALLAEYRRLKQMVEDSSVLEEDV